MAQVGTLKRQKNASSPAGALGDLFSSENKERFKRVKARERSDAGIVAAPAPAPTAVPAAPAVVNRPTAKKGKKKKDKKRKHVEDDKTVKEEGDSGADQRTIFIGNVGLSVTIKAIKKAFAEFGKVESVRLRSQPVAGAKVKDHGNDKAMRKACAIKGQFSEETKKDTCNAYVVFEKRENAEAALALNGQIVHELGGRHLRVDRCGRNQTMAHKRSVFLGNVPYDVDDEQLRAWFALKLARCGGDDCIENLRLVRDRETHLTKGFGFLLLKDAEAVGEALALHQESFEGHKLRVTVCGRRFKRQGQQEEASGGSGASPRAMDEKGPTLKKAKKAYDFESSAPRAFEGQRASLEPTGAQRRIETRRKLKTLKKNKIDKAKGRKKSQDEGAVVKAKAETRQGKEKGKGKGKGRGKGQGQGVKKSDKDSALGKKKKPKHAARKAAQAKAAAEGKVWVNPKKNQ